MRFKALRRSNRDSFAAVQGDKLKSTSPKAKKKRKKKKKKPLGVKSAGSSRTGFGGARERASKQASPTGPNEEMAMECGNERR